MKLGCSGIDCYRNLLVPHSKKEWKSALIIEEEKNTPYILSTTELQFKQIGKNSILEPRAK